MERLTNKREADAQRENYERRLANGYPRNIPEERFLRLAAYEDTHMMPSDVTSMRMDMAIIAALFNGVDVDRMKELAEADKDERVVVAPCKVGDVLYRASPSGVVVHRVVNVVYKGLTSRWYIDTIPNLPYASEELGKTTFFTCEAAGKALEAMKKGETEHA